MSQQIKTHFTCTEGGSNKEYEIHLIAEGDGYVLHTYHGASGRSLKLTVKTKAPVPYEVAKKAYDKAYSELLAKHFKPSDTAGEMAATKASAGEQPAQADSDLTGIEIEKAKRRLMRARREGNQSKIMAAETRLRRMRTAVFQADDWIEAARQGDISAIAKLEEAGFVDVADTLRADNKIVAAGAVSATRAPTTSPSIQMSVIAG
jgi:hypothetical protein